MKKQNSSGLSKKYDSISYLRIFSTFCVIFLHTCSTLTDNPKIFLLSKSQIIFFNAAHEMMAWAVPVFFMITGMLFLRSDFNIKTEELLFKYSRRIMLALMLFGIPYAAIKYYSSSGLRSDIFGKSIIAVLTDRGFSHLWYLYVLIGLYLVMPILKRFYEVANKKEITFILTVLFILDFCFPIISNLLKLDIAFKSQILYSAFYVLLGRWLFDNKQIFNSNKLILLSGLIIMLIWILNVINCVPGMLTQYDSPLIAILAAIIFLLFVNKKWKPRKWLWIMDRLCFGAYLIHPLFIQIFYRKLRLTPANYSSCYPIITIIYAILFIALAFLSTWLMKKSEFIRRYVL